MIFCIIGNSHRVLAAYFLVEKIINYIFLKNQTERLNKKEWNEIKKEENKR